MIFLRDLISKLFFVYQPTLVMPLLSQANNKPKEAFLLNLSFHFKYFEMILFFRTRYLKSKFNAVHLYFLGMKTNNKHQGNLYSDYGTQLERISKTSSAERNPVKKTHSLMISLWKTFLKLSRLHFSNFYFIFFLN